MNIVLILLILLCAFVYVKYYTEPNKKIEIIQPKLSQLDQAHLQEKLPVVIAERIVDLKQFSEKVFKYLYVHKLYQPRAMATNGWEQIKYRYSIIYATRECELVLVHPYKMKKNKEYSDAVSMKLYPHQLVIVPYKWWINIDKDHARISLHDTLSLLL